MLTEEFHGEVGLPIGLSLAAISNGGRMYVKVDVCKGRKR